MMKIFMTIGEYSSTLYVYEWPKKKVGYPYISSDELKSLQLHAQLSHDKLILNVFTTNNTF